MIEYRIEHDTMGEVRVPKNAKYQAQTQRAVENFPISGRTLEQTADPRAGADQVGGGDGQRPARRHPAGHRRRDRRGRQPDRRRRVLRRLPARRLPDRLRHQLQHERQRGDRHPGRRVAGRQGAPERSRQRLAVLQRRLPHLDPRRGHRVHRPEPAARAGPPGGGAGGEVGRVGHRRQVRPHPPDGRHPGHPRPGVRRLRRADPARPGAARTRPCPGSPNCRSAAPPSAPASTPRPASPPR